MTAPLLELDGLEVTFGTGTGAVRALRGVDLTVQRGQTVAIVGESGSGKSTLAHALVGLLPGAGRVTGGRITFEGRDLAHASERTFVGIRGSGIGFVPQDPATNLDPVWKIGFQVRETLAANGIAKGRAAHRRAAELLAQAGLDDAEARAGRYPHEFSGGMRQRVLIAIGLAARPRLLIADEPTSALDVTVQQRVLDHLERLTDELGTALLLITHDLGVAAERAEHVVVMHAGAVVESGSPEQILTAPEHPYTRRLVAAAPSLGATPTRQPPNAPAGAHPLLVVDGLRKLFHSRRAEVIAVDDVSFTVDRGTTTAIVGESGSGKTTVSRMILGLLPPDGGSVLFDGTDPAALGRREKEFRRRVQPVFQDPYGSLDPTYSVFRIVEEPMRVHRIGDRGERARRVRDLLERVALPADLSRRFPAELSGGQRQRVAIARALALAPELLVCDEAVSALDVVVQDQILRLLDELQRDLGLTYVFVSHDLAVVRRIADRVVVMHGGRVVEEAAAEDVFEHPGHEYTRRLLDAVPAGRRRRRDG
ncbi:ABC transporter ATP-binding protein [Prescottella equi]|uniref:Dipeptide ABC transporter ATP-binding protein n=1 Tax=Rhodococcus hoagii TaxID=43767 RepID=A0A9Q4ZVE5_RHOHA|nr:ABC transporter ATP-binding protein [Prescottella equi]MBM4489947.1 dipeptide ABC transporter ATP-binding protein [Prescottella equi]MBM4501027.1 dipeptide ABC transporter ATP-binding protein [Prescottella equi]MBM4502748.1 dipeptide ABC transporter ATP-binding protein [Prescottella equi]MBM4517349.1 dipeptide ABC transporter ATP-binding protein [Prescottella equi]MBM4548279.1 dipeptide ABC transporter ATP-binding protein [Prescottella equi]